MSEHFHISGRASSLLLAAFFGTLTTSGFVIAFQSCQHWYVLPVTACGILMGTDAIEWFRGRLYLFDPGGVLGLLGVHLFYLAPLLHVALNGWMYTPLPPEDWRPWLGLMGCLNLLGMGIYLASRKWALRRPALRQGTTAVRVFNDRFFSVILLGLGVSFAAQAAMFAFSRGSVEVGAPENSGWVFMVSESFPILLLIAVLVSWRKKGLQPTLLQVLVILVLFFLVSLPFGGLRGSRSNLVWKLFWAVGIIHCVVRPLPRRFVLAGVPCLVLLMHAYGFYEAGGLQGFREFLRSPGSYSAASGNPRVGIAKVLIGDFSRADIQALLLYRILRDNSDYDCAYGRTYLADVAVVLPHPVRPAILTRVTKTLAGTEAVLGKYSYIPKKRWCAYTYGVAGEALLNFGPLAVPLAFLPVGIVVGSIRRCMAAWPSGDVRWLLLPFLVNLCIVMLIGDADNVAFFLGKNGLIPVLVIYLGSASYPVASRPRAAVRLASCREEVACQLNTSSAMR